jgi:peptidoglycan-associated lipoprotein
MRPKLFGIFAALLLIAACETTPEESADSVSSGDSTESMDSDMMEEEAESMGESMDSMDKSEEERGPVPGSDEDFYSLGDRVFFDFDKFSLKAPARRVLERQADWLNTYDNVSITIEGHCDERGTREYNLALGERRASAVKNYMISLGVDPGRVSTISYGKERPDALGSNEAAWSQNRRGVSVIN